MHPAKFITKALNHASGAVFYVWNRCVFLAWARYGKNVRFQGLVHCHGVTGSIEFGDSVLIGSGVSLSVANGGQIFIGSDSSINKGTVISSLKEINIGSGVRIGEYCSIRDNDHKIHGRDRILNSGFNVKPISIGNDVWIGRNSTIMPGCTIGEGVVIGANSFVNRDVPAFSIAVGSPIRITRSRS